MSEHYKPAMRDLRAAEDCIAEVRRRLARSDAGEPLSEEEGERVVGKYHWAEKHTLDGMRSISQMPQGGVREMFMSELFYTLKRVQRLARDLRRECIMDPAEFPSTKEGGAA